MFYNFTKISRFAPLFKALEKCKGVEQNAEHHPEGDVFTHSLQCLYWAFKETEDVDLIVAAMTHDVGKCVQKLGHHEYSVKMLEGSISAKTEWLVYNHMRFWDMMLGGMRKKSKVDALVQNKWFPDLCRLARFDKLGRNPNKKIEYDRNKILDKLRILNKE